MIRILRGLLGTQIGLFWFRGLLSLLMGRFRLDRRNVAQDY